MMPPVRSVPPPDAAAVVYGRRSSEAAWTGEKRRKTVEGPSPPVALGSSSSDDAIDGMLMDDTRPLQEAELGREELGFSAEDDLDDTAWYQELKSRERPIYVQWAVRLKGKAKEELFNRLTGLRFREYKLLKDGGLNWDDTTDTVPISEYPEEVWDWENPSRPGRGMFGWTFDPKYFHLAELDDYQRIVPIRALTPDFDEYYNWEEYRLTFSNYETDVEYVQYWEELPKKIEWIDEYLHLDVKQFIIYKYRGARQATRIAASFCHLPASLATRGYDEYLVGLQDDLDFRKGYDRVYFEVWKQMSKQEMSFQEALVDIFSSEKLPPSCENLPPSCLYRIQSEMAGRISLLSFHFNICMKHIRELVVDADEDAVLKHFTDVVYTKLGRKKMYVDYVKKKLEVARRIGVLP